MEIKSNTYKIRGMNKDLSYKSFNPNYSFDNKNIRLTARGDNGLLRVSNESGNKINWFNFIKTDVSYSYLIQMFEVFRDILYNFKQAVSGYVDLERDILYNFKQLTSSYVEIYRDIYYSNTYAVGTYIYESREQYNQYAQSTGTYVYETTNI